MKRRETNRHRRPVAAPAAHPRRRGGWLRRSVRNRQSTGLTLLEMVIASSMLALLLTAVAVLLRTGRQSWEAQVSEYRRVEAAHATMRHIVREVRQAVTVSFVSDSNDNSGRLSVLASTGDTQTWLHDPIANQVNYGLNVANPNQLLSPDIVGLRFTGLRADGVTQTTLAGEVQCLQIDVSFQLPRETTMTRVVSSQVWLRSW